MGRTDVLKTIKREIEELKKRRTECGNELGRASKVASKHNFSIFFSPIGKYLSSITKISPVQIKNQVRNEQNSKIGLKGLQ